MGILAEMQRDAERRRKLEVREAKRSQRERERAQREQERWAARDEKERKRLYVESRGREAEALSRELRAVLDSLESLLSKTLEVDDYIDLASLKTPFRGPPFTPGTLDEETPEPVLVEVAKLSPFAGLIPGAKTKHQAALAEASEAHEEALASWQEGEDRRQAELTLARTGHDDRVRKKKAEIDQANAQIDEFDARLDGAEAAAIVDYLGMVLDRSRYPEEFPGGHKLAYVPESKQIVVEHGLPTFDVVPEEKEFKYVKSRDEITASSRPESQRKALYSKVIAE